jgi:hypothetical protein
MRASFVIGSAHNDNDLCFATPYLSPRIASWPELSPESRRRSIDPSPSAVGIFWAIQKPGKPTILLDHRCLLGDTENYGDMLTCPHGHYDLWEQWRRGAGEIPDVARGLVAASEYEEWPRGRIVYDTIHQRFTCYADAKILRRADLLAVRGDIPAGILCHLA